MLYFLLYFWGCKLNRPDTKCCQCIHSIAGRKHAVAEHDAGESVEPKRKQRRKKRRLKEEPSLWEESRRPADHPSTEPQAAETSPAEKTVETAKSSRAGTGWCYNTHTRAPLKPTQAAGK